MKKIFFASLTCLFLFAACKHDRGNPPVGSPGSDTAYISIDTANIMLQSYLTSINAPSEDSSLRSMLIDANALRDYLNGDRSITHMKIMLAHNMDWINSGHAGQNCGYNDSALTFILAGIDTADNYVFLPNLQVQNHGDPCPRLCEVQGTAQSDLLIKPR